MSCELCCERSSQLTAACGKSEREVEGETDVCAPRLPNFRSHSHSGRGAGIVAGGSLLSREPGAAARERETDLGVCVCLLVCIH